MNYEDYKYGVDPAFTSYMSKRYVKVSEEARMFIKKAIKQSDYKTIECFAEKALYIHKVSLSRKLQGSRNFTKLEIYAIEQALGIKIDEGEIKPS